ncbi:MAG: DEAD/DEAH box helicase family protein, partial [Gammaproteobacteria bacterium]
MILKIALANIQHDYFEYLPPPSSAGETLTPGIRIKVPLRNKQVIGVLVGTTSSPQTDVTKLKPALEIIDRTPLLSTTIIKLCQWASNYYHHPLGDVFVAALPNLLRQGKGAQVSQEFFLQITELGTTIDTQAIKRAPQQQKLLTYLQHHKVISKAELSRLNFSTAAIKNLVAKDYLTQTSQDIPVPISDLSQQAPLTLNADQHKAYLAIEKKLNQYHCFLLAGITGSGKTEIYLQTIAQLIDKKKQVLILAPEIGLTPQLVQHLRQRFQKAIVSLHSGLTDRERLNT